MEAAAAIPFKGVRRFAGIATYFGIILESISSGSLTQLTAYR